MWQLRNASNIKLSAIHINHGLQTAADDWSRACQAQADIWAIDFTLSRINATPKAGDSPEAAARDARYTALRAELQPGDWLLAAQHQNDQAETLLLQLLRGSGPAGLASMAAISRFDPGFLVRPLLPWSRTAIVEYAQRHQLIWLEDPSNQQTDFDRNFIRKEIIPRLEKRWPAVSKSLSRSARLCAEADEQLKHEGDHALATCLDNKRIDLKKMAQQSSYLQVLSIRAWFRLNTLEMPSQRMLDELFNRVILARADSSPRLRWREAEIRRYRHHLYLYIPPLSEKQAASNFQLNWHDPCRPLTLPNNTGRLRFDAGIPNLSPSEWPQQAITVRYRRAGDRIQAGHKPHHQDLKARFQHAGIPPWERDTWPLVCMGDEIIAIAQRTADKEIAKPAYPFPKVLWDTASTQD